MSDGFGLAALFGMNAGIGAVGIDQRKNGSPKFFRNPHDAQRLAIALGMWRAEVSMHALLHVAAFLRADNKHFIAVKAGHSANNGRIVSKGAITVDFTPVRKETVNVVECLGTLWMPRQFSLLPRGGVSGDFAAKSIDAGLQTSELPAGGIVLLGGFHLCHLALDLLQFFLRFKRNCHGIQLGLQLMTRTLPRPHSCSTRAMKLRSGSTL